MVRIARRTFIAIVGSVVVACGDDSTGSSLPSIAGTWTVTKAEMISVANPSNKLDLIAFGLSVSIVINSNQTFTRTSTFPGESPEVATGTYSYTSGHLTMNDTSSSPPETLSFALTLSGNTMTLSGGSATFEFGTGGEEAATLNLTLTR